MSRTPRPCCTFGICWRRKASVREKVGTLSTQNLGFLYEVYYNAVIDTINVLLNASNVSLEGKLSGLRELLSTDITLEMLESDAVELDRRQNLLKQIVAAVESLGGHVACYGDAIWLGLTVSALLGNQEKYVYFSKLQIHLLINNHRQEEATAQLDEWESILPNDPELKVLRGELCASMQLLHPPKQAQ